MSGGSFPLSHEAEIIGTILKMVVEERPLLYLGLPGTIFIIIAIALGTYILLLFNATRYSSLPIAILALGGRLGEDDPDNHSTHAIRSQQGYKKNRELIA
ncbi:MAG: hypothetical protein ACP5IE_07065 [Infirmifilum sp.]